METRETVKVGKRGITIIPARIRKHYKLEEGSILIIEEKKDGIFLRPSVVTPLETNYTE